MSRLRIPFATVLLALSALGWIWLGSESMRQVRVIATLAISATAGLILLGWFLFGSGLSAKVRFGVAVGMATALGLFGSAFRIRGVTGDLVPILEFRFARTSALPEAPARPPAPTERQADNSETPGPAAPDQQPPGPPAGTPTPAADPADVVAAPPPGDPEGPTARADRDWPQFLGPNRSGVVAAPDLATDWDAEPPRLLWRQAVGTGWAGFAVADDLAVTLEQRGPEERVMAYELATGQPVWSHADLASHDSPLGGEGPRSVPTIDAGQVFSLGATGLLNAFDLRDGRLLWGRNILEDSGAFEPDWGVAVSPLVHGNRVIVSAGGSAGRALMAYDRSTGEPLWAQGTGGLAYSSPVLLNLAGRDQIVMLNKSSVAAHDPDTGALLWEEDFPREQPNVSQPLRLSENRVLFSVGYGVGSRVFEISAEGQRLAAKLVWSTRRLKSKFANMVAYRGSVYGLDDGVFVCLDPETGERRWKEGRFGHGQLILAGDRLLVQTEEGEVVMIQPDPERLIELTRFRALDGKTWNPPALAGRILLVRNDLEAAAYELPTVPR